MKRVFQGALEGPADLPQYLDRECAGDADLRSHVEALLESHARPGDSLEELVIPAGLGDEVTQEVKEPESKRIGPYRTIREIAHGGMGTVYLAERCDGQYEKTVAIKLVTPAMDMSSVLARFRTERQILANLEHPNIARLLDGGLTDDGHPYIVMEYIDGSPIDDYCNRHELSIEDRLKLFEVVCDAVQYAHQNLVIHRDIKPSNVLVTETGVPKLLDFGIGKIVGPQVHTSTTQLTTRFQPMTPDFASPEQLNGDPVNASSDIYSLGVLLHIVLPGCHPSQPGSSKERTRRLGRDLEDIVGMCLRKEPEQRYPTVAALADDIRRHLDDRPIMARRQTAAYRAAKFVRRNKFTLKITACTLAVCLVLILGLLSVRTNNRSAGPKFRSVAVLPFKNISSDDANEYLELGMADVLTARLSHLKQINVTPTSAVREYRSAGQNPVAAGRALQVDSVLQSNIQKSGDQIRVTAQLIDTHKGTPLWAGTFDEKLTNIFALQDSIATKISSALQLEVTAVERERLYRRYTENVEAYESYLRGRSELLRYDRQQTLAAVQAFDKALKLDPNYALAYAGLATASAQMRLRFATQQEINSWEDRARQYADRALKLDPSLAEAHEALAAVYGQTEFDWDRTLEESRLALERNSNLDMPHYYRGRSFYHLGLFERSDEESLLGSKISTENRISRLRVQGVTALFASRFAEAVSILEESKRLNDATVDWQLAMAYFYVGDRERAERMLAKPGGGAQAEQRAGATLASFLAARGEKGKAIAMLRGVIDYGYKDHHVAYSIGAAYAQLGNPSEALLWLTRAKDSGFPCYPWYKQDPLLQPLHSDEGFKALMAALAKEWELTKSRYARS